MNSNTIGYMDIVVAVGHAFVSLETYHILLILYYCYNLCHLIISILDAGSKQKTMTQKIIGVCIDYRFLIILGVNTFYEDIESKSNHRRQGE